MLYVKYLKKQRKFYLEKYFLVKRYIRDFQISRSRVPLLSYTMYIPEVLVLQKNTSHRSFALMDTRILLPSVFFWVKSLL